MSQHITAEQILEKVVRTADEKKARDITAMRVTEQTTLADYFVVMTGTSSTHIHALNDEIEKKLKEDWGLYPHHTEGITSNWILMDYSVVVVNIFLADTRELYALERLWGDSHVVDIEKFKKED